MPAAALLAGPALNLVGSLFGRSKRKRAARSRRAANTIQRQQASISNELSRRRAVTQQRRLQANSAAQAAALGVSGSSATAAQAGSLDSQLAVNISRQRQQETADARIASLGASAQRNDARAQFTEGLASTFASFTSAALAPKPVVGAG